MELGIKYKRNSHVTTGKSQPQLKAYEVSPKSKRICKVQSLANRSDNSTAAFDIRKWRELSSLIRKIKQVHQTIEKTRNLNTEYSPTRSQKRNSGRFKQITKSSRLQIKGEDFQTDMSSDEFEPNNRLILTTLQQPTAKIHANYNTTWGNNNR
ncbi:MAG: hypothetical protein EZS28_046259, partial [Streblomastix strix]